MLGCGEEAFTVYDHPKVFIFRKQDSYDPQNIRDILGAIDLTKVIHVTPKGAESLPKDMLMTPAQSALQRANGTWSELFNTTSPLNRWPYLGLVVWYLTLSALGWLVYPLVRFAFPVLSDKGFPLSRISWLIDPLLFCLAGWIIPNLVHSTDNQLGSGIDCRDFYLPCLLATGWIAPGMA